MKAAAVYVASKRFLFKKGKNLKNKTFKSMTGNTANPNPGYQPTPKPSNNKTGFIVAIAILAVASIGLLIATITQNKAKTEFATKLTETEQLKADVEKQYYAALSELEEMRGSNEELNALIEKQKEELATQKDKIDVLLRDSKNLSQARAEVKRLNSLMQQYVAEINQLREQNQELTAENSQLSEQKTALEGELTTQKMTNEELSSAKAALVSEKESLEKDKASLSKKVNYASVIKVTGLEIEGLKTKSSGKTSKERKASNIDQLQICFSTTVNEVAEQGAEVYHIRVIDPQGVTLAVEDLGSGVFTSSANDDQLPFTTSKEFDYNNNATKLCSTWAPNQPFTKGTYKVEIYNKGYMAGAGSITLK